MNKKNELASLTKESNELEFEAVALKNIESAHSKAIKEIDANSMSKKRFGNMRSEFTLTRDKVKEKMDELRQEERNVALEHEQIIQMEEKCRKLNQLLRENNSQSDQVPMPVPEIDDKEIAALKLEIDNLDKELKADEPRYLATNKKNYVKHFLDYDKIFILIIITFVIILKFLMLFFNRMHKKMEDDLKNETAEADLVRAKLREKEQEIRISDMKINDLTRRMMVKPQIDEDKQKPQNKKKGSATQYPNSLSSARKQFISSELDESKVTKKSVGNDQKTPILIKTTDKRSSVPPQYKATDPELSREEKFENKLKKTETSNISSTIRKNKNK